MKSLLIRWALPVVGIGAICGIGFWARAMGWLPDHIAFWLWPSLVAMIFLGLGVFVFLQGARAWIAPFAVGFVAQLVGLMLLMAETFESSWEPLWWSLGAVSVVLVVMGIVWLVNYLRARSLERRMAEGMAEGVTGNEAELGRIRKDMMDALGLLRRAGKGRNAIYELPWFLVMGRPAAGKTVAIKNSGLSLPVRKDWVKGVGGTYTCDWFFTNELIFLDTPGGWVTEGTDEAGQKQWNTLLRLLRRYRGRRPLDGLVVVVPADDLLSKDEDELEQQAANVRDVVDLMHDELHFRFPIYLLVTKCDLVEGFVDFFRALPAQRRNEILGWSNEDTNDDDVRRLIHGGFRRVQRRLEAYRLEMLGRIAKKSQTRKLFFFTEDFRSLEAPLTHFAEVLFESDRYHESPVFRGFYFSSGTQGEGAPLSKAMSSLARALGVSETRQVGSASEEPKRSYFLLDLFRELMVEDEGLVGRTAGHWWKQRRNTMLGAFAPAGLALGLLLLSLVSFAWHKSTYRSFASNAASISQKLAEEREGAGDLGQRITASLGHTEKLRDYHRRMASFSPLRSLGMRRENAPIALASLDLFRREFSESALRPLLSASQSYATGADGQEVKCVDRLEILRSVVWLRLGKRFETSGQLESIIEKEDARRELARQYRYFKENLGSSDGTSLMPGFRIRKVTESIRANCSGLGASSALAAYERFQQDCREMSTAASVVECEAQLHGSLAFRQEDFAVFKERLDQVMADLEELKSEEAEAEEGIELLADVEVPDPAEGSDCLTKFADTWVKDIREYVDSEDLLTQCRDKAATQTSRGAKLRATREVRQALEDRLDERGTALRESFADFSVGCRDAVVGFRRLDYDVLRNVVATSMRVRCFGEGGDALAQAAPAPSRPKKVSVVSAQPRRSKPRSTPRSGSLNWLQSAASVGASHTRSGWDRAYVRWGDELAGMEVGFSETQKRQETERIEGEVRSYARAYAKSWERYLGGLQLKPRSIAEADWLRELATTDEYKKLLEPAVEALDLDGISDSPFDAMKDGLGSLEEIKRFVASDLGEYRGLLNAVSEDLEKCASDDAAFASYQQGLLANDRNNSLVSARNWVRLRVSSLAGGELLDLFAAPFAEAESFVKSDNLLESRWGDLAGLYRDEIQGRSPFGSGGTEPVSEAALKALLGGKTGAVKRILEVVPEGGLSADARSWLERAANLSRIFFEEGKDELKPIRVQLKVGDGSFEPEKFGKNHQLSAFEISFGPEDRFRWTDEKPDENSKRLSLRLFGDEASRSGYVKGWVSKKQILGKFLPGANWKKSKPITAETLEDVPLAPLELLRRGQTPGDDSRLSFTVVVLDDKDREKAKVEVPITLTGSEIVVLLELMDRGLAPPPASFGG